LKAWAGIFEWLMQGNDAMRYGAPDIIVQRFYGWFLGLQDVTCGKTMIWEHWIHVSLCSMFKSWP
jgi:hypothetical protein